MEKPCDRSPIISPRPPTASGAKDHETEQYALFRNVILRPEPDFSDYVARRDYHERLSEA